MESSSNSTLGLTKVVLYKHGIGYFERRGKVTGPTKIDLVCEASEIDDMLKSLLALTGGGSRIDAITYDSSKTLESRLAEFGFDITQCQGLSALLGQMKGIPVTIKASGETISGRVLGLDYTEQLVNESVLHEEQLTLYTKEHSFKRVGLSSISEIKVDDENMASELKQQLELLFQNAKKKDRKALSVTIGEPGEHELLIAYSIPCPIWKTSYRLVMNDKSRVLLQGMAIVDNVQEEDWSDVQVVLVSASPISFIQPLYDPVQPARQRIAAQGNISSGPVTAERAQRQRQEAVPAQSAMRVMAAPMAAPGAGGAWGAPSAGAVRGGDFYGNAPVAADQMSMMMEEGFGAPLQIESEEKGELFEYRINKPVTIPRNSSALIPIVQQDVEGERISLYNEGKNARFPHAAVRFVNNTGLTLESGPVTVMEGDIYAGEALLDTTKPDDLRFLLYAVDQSCPVIVRLNSIARPFWRVRCMHGSLYLDFRQCNEKTYEIENLSDQKKVIYVEHPLYPLWTIVSEPKPTETTQNYYRFRLEIEPKKLVSLPVKEESDSYEQIWIQDPNRLDLKRLDWLCGQNFVDTEFIRFLRKLMEMRTEIMSVQEEMGQQAQLLKQYTDDQQRARENLKTLGANNERYRTIIDRTEDQITETNKRIQALNRDIQQKVRAYQELALAQIDSDMESAGKRKKDK